MALKVAAKHGTNAGTRASKAAFDYAMQKSAQFSTLLRENPQLFMRLLNKQLTDDFAQFGGQSSGLNAERFAIAKELAQKGVSDEEILSRTGWFKGLDGEWKIQLDLRDGAAYKLKEGESSRRWAGRMIRKSQTTQRSHIRKRICLLSLKPRASLRK